MPRKTLERRIEVLSCFAAVFFTLAIVAAWHFTDKQYPKDDAAEFAVKAQELYQNFSFSRLYFDRSWRPTLHHAFAVPFLFLTGGNIRQAVALAGFFGMWVFLTYLYFFARLYLNRAAAVLTATVIGTLPWLIYNAFHFNAEIYFLAASVVAFFHLTKADFGKSKVHSLLFGLVLGLAACIRPVETLAYFTLPVAFYLYRAKRIALYGVSVAMLIAALWFAPFYSSFVPWIKISGLYKDDTHTLISREGFATKLAMLFGSFPLLWIALTALIGELAARRLSEKSNLKPLVQKKELGIFLLFFFSSCVSLGVGILSYNPETRYYYVGVTGVVLAALISALRADRPWWCVRMGLVSMSAAVQTALLVTTIATGLPNRFYGIAMDLGWQPWLLTPIRERDPAIDLVAEVEKATAVESPGLQATRVGFLYLWANSRVDWEFEPYGLSTISNERGNRMTIDTDVRVPLTVGEMTRKHVLQKYDYLLLGPVGGKGVSWLPTAIFAEQLISRWQQGRPVDPSLKYVAQFSHQAHIHQDGELRATGRFLLFRVLAKPL